MAVIASARRLALALLLAGILPGQALGFPPLFSHRLTQRSELRFAADWRILAVECGDDSSDEILKVAARQTLCVRLSRGSWIPQWHLSYEPGVLEEVQDIAGDGRLGLTVASELPGGESWLTAYHVSPARGPEPLYRLGPFLGDCPRGFENRRGLVQFVSCFDADGNGKPEIYLCAYPFAPGVEPRRLLALDGASGESLWSFNLAPPIIAADLLVTPAGRRQILVSTYSPGNEFYYDGTCDTSSYLYSLTPGGRL